MRHFFSKRLNEIKSISIAVFGVGGTGSFLVEELVKIIAYNHLTDKYEFLFRIYDDDKVSEGSVIRGNFTMSELNEYKGKALGQRLGRLYGVKINWFPSDEAYIGANFNFICVDSVRARNNIYDRLIERSISSVREEYRAMYAMDFGNHATGGQVILGTTHNIVGMGDEGAQLLETFVDIYRGLKDDNDTEPSCSVIQSVARQGIFTNNIIALYGANMFYELITKDFINYSAVYFDNSQQTMTVKKLIPDKKDRVL